MKLYTVDAFTNIPFKGNPAGVCISPFLPQDELMQHIATELGYSNTAFLQPLDKNKYHIRWFTTVSEAPICGHATIAAAHVLSSERNLAEKTLLQFESLAGPLSARIEGDGWYTLDFPAYQVLAVPLGNELKMVLGDIEPTFVGVSENCFFVELASDDELKQLNPNLEQLKQLPCRALIATARGREYDFHSRYFAPKVGINEDPVCASAHCRLIPYWAQKLNKKEMRAFQLSKRGGEIKCQDLGNRVLISGEAVTVMVSELLI
jgi:PhzF family phenazine biosynthesis protein